LRKGKIKKIVAMALVCASIFGFILPASKVNGAVIYGNSQQVEEKLKNIVSEYGSENLIFENGIILEVGDSINFEELEYDNVTWHSVDEEILTISDKIVAKSKGTTFLIGNMNNKYIIREVYVHQEEMQVSLFNKKTVARNQYLVYLDPGHGGYDPGARGNGIVEKELVLNLGNRIKAKLEEKGIQVVMSRTSDDYVSLKDRSSGANSINPDLFISIHGNSALSSAAKGIETFYYKSMDKPLAQELQNKLISNTGAVNRGAKYENFHVIRETKMPASLVEVGFLSNSSEANNLKNYEYQEKIVNAIVDGAVKYLNENINLSEYSIPYNRLFGANRYETSYRVFEQGWDSSKTAILASGLDYADALTATPLAKKHNAPILLVKNSGLSGQGELLNVLKAKGVKNVFIVGGNSIIPSSIEGELSNAGISSKRLAGANRYETSVEIAKEVSSDTGEIALVSGMDFADGLSISAIAGQRNMPILLTKKAEMPKVISDYINTLKVNKTYVVGLNSAINDHVVNNLPNTERLGGSDRYETNKVIFDKFRENIKSDKLFLASGLNFPDALSSSASAAKGGSFVLLSKPKAPSSATGRIIAENSQLIKNIYVLGSEIVIDDNTLSTYGLTK